MTNSNSPLITRLTLITAFIIGICLCGLTFFIQTFLIPNINIENNKAIQVEITPVDESLLSEAQNSNHTQSEALAETPTIPGVIALGMVVEITGTGNEGLRMRQNAGIDEPTLSLALDGEKYKITAGPVVLDSLVWWKIENLENSSKAGWSVQDYMTPK